MQFHGAADRYTARRRRPPSPRSISTATTPTANPAVTVRSGRQQRRAGGGVHLRPGAVGRLYAPGQSGLVGQERDGHRADPLGRPLLRRRAAGLRRSLDKVAIPQADEQQRLLANLIGFVNARSQAAAAVLVFPARREGRRRDDRRRSRQQRHRGAVRHLQRREPAGLQRRGLGVRPRTSYIYPVDADQPDAGGRATYAQGFEIGVHITTDCGDYTPSSLDGELHRRPRRSSR